MCVRENREFYTCTLLLCAGLLMMAGRTGGVGVYGEINPVSVAFWREKHRCPSPHLLIFRKKRERPTR